MNHIPRFSAVLGLALLAAACGSNVQPTPAAGPPEMRSRVSAALATPRMHHRRVRQRAEVQQRRAVPEVQRHGALRAGESLRISTDFSKESECRNGVATTSLEECIQRTAAQTCDGLSSVITNMERAGACGASDLCLH